MNKMKKETLMVDMDNVITDGLYFEYIGEFLGRDLRKEKVTTYFLQELVGDRKNEFWEWIKDKNFYEGTPLLSGCLEVLEKLNEKYELYIVTAYLWKDEIDASGENLKNKYYYLKEMLPFIKPEQYVFTTNKSIMNFDIRIDDRLNNASGSRVGLLFDAWHNQEYTAEELEKYSVRRVMNWNEVAEILL